VLGRFVRGIVTAAERAGIARRGLTRASGIDEATLDDPEARVPLPQYLALWRAIDEARPDPCFGVRAAIETLEDGAADILDYLVRASETAQEALERLVRYREIVVDSSDLGMAFDRAHDPPRIVLGPPASAAPWSRHRAEHAVAAIVFALRDEAAFPVVPLRVEFQHDAPGEEPTEHERLLGAEVVFGAPAHAVCFDAASLSVPMKRADASLLAHLERRAAEIMRGRRRNLVEDIRRAVLAALPTRQLDAEDVARELGLTKRTMQRRLFDQGVTYSALVDDVKCEQAAHWLRGTEMSILEVGAFLGYSDAEAFRKAFRRWTGHSPRDYRSIHQEVARASALETLEPPPEVSSHEPIAPVSPRQASSR
jgi:AraC-like DNA-binding protein